MDRAAGPQREAPARPSCYGVPPSKRCIADDLGRQYRPMALGARGSPRQSPPPVKPAVGHSRRRLPSPALPGRRRPRPASASASGRAAVPSASAWVPWGCPGPATATRRSSEEPVPVVGPEQVMVVTEPGHVVEGGRSPLGEVRRPVVVLEAEPGVTARDHASRESRSRRAARPPGDVAPGRVDGGHVHRVGDEQLDQRLTQQAVDLLDTGTGPTPGISQRSPPWTCPRRRASRPTGRTGWPWGPGGGAGPPGGGHGPGGGSPGGPGGPLGPGISLPGDQVHQGVGAVGVGGLERPCPPGRGRTRSAWASRAELSSAPASGASTASRQNAPSASVKVRHRRCSWSRWRWRWRPPPGPALGLGPAGTAP